ncbi:DUF364 domain-containing protein [Eubacterium oxidoreducens]|uniref:Heavy-metal chelation n=1 Tax=Eubacterium oxidoreducens TaxID=1732 RepID=A0A1G6AAR5_EUBOX|nr:DUF364 domain-containing protein [Eubacterium oxidoreducens]SDB05491.1 hypothetical protein SAMN02910417_00360 [Eubacterium oxidoreducens]
MWKIYDELIAGIKEDIVVEDYVYGGHFSMIRAGEYNGVAHSFGNPTRPWMYSCELRGRTLKDVARGVKSWNLEEATMGMCAINAYYNSREHITKLGLDYFTNGESCKQAREKNDPFNNPEEAMKGKYVAVIGHFPHIEEQLKAICDLHVLELSPRAGDYPASACEDLIPKADYVFATGMTFGNKTIPRLLELRKKDAKFSIVGPSGPITPVLFDHGVTRISSYVVTDPEFVFDVIKNNKRGMFSGGKMIEYDITERNDK